jgi:hypothetical protein
MSIFQNAVDPTVVRSTIITVQGDQIFNNCDMSQGKHELAEDLSEWILSYN